MKKSASQSMNNMAMIQASYQPVITAACDWCQARFDKRFLAAFIAGSVALGEAMPNVSDLDFWVFIEDEPNTGDKISRHRTERRLENTFSFVPTVHLNLHSLYRLINEPFWRFIVAYNAVQVAGSDVINRSNALAAVTTPEPDTRLAQSRLPFVRNCFETALQGNTPPSLDQLPDDTFLAARKLARNFVVVEGAHLLMTKRRFTGFRQHVVIETLSDLFPQWGDLLNISKTVIMDPLRAGISAPEYMELVKPFVEWMLLEIEMYPEPYDGAPPGRNKTSSPGP